MTDLPIHFISIKNNFVSQLYKEGNIQKWKLIYPECNFKFLTIDQAFTPKTLKIAEKKYPELRISPNVTATERAVWYSQWDCINKIVKNNETQIIMEHDCCPLHFQPKIDWQEILSYDYYTFTYSHVRDKWVKSEIGGYVLSPRLAKKFIDMVVNGDIYMKNPDGAIAVFLKEVNKKVQFGLTSNFKSITNEFKFQADQMDILQNVKVLPEWVGAYQYIIKEVGTTIQHKTTKKYNSNLNK